MSILTIMMKKNEKTTVPALFGMVSFVLFIISFFLSINVESSKLITLLRMAITTASAACYYLCYRYSDANCDYKRQISWVNVAVLLYHILYCIGFLKIAFFIRYRSQIYMEAVWILVCIEVLLSSRDVISECFKRMKENDSRFWLLISLCFAIVLIVLSYDVKGPRFVWDARSFYDRMAQLETSDVFDISKFFLFSHVDVSYFYSIFLLARICGSLSHGYWLYNAICLLTASFGVVNVLKKTIDGKSRIFVILASSACLLSPYVCGISTHYTYDFAICCLSPLLIKFAIDEDWIYFVVLSAYISLLKETGIVFVGSVCIGIVLSEMICEKKPVKKVIFRIRTVGAASVCLMFIAIYRIYSEWESAYQVGGFGFDKEHMRTVIKMIGVLNFEWIVVLFVLFMVIVCLAKGIGINRYVVVYLTSSVILLVFYILYVTNEYPRYTESFPVYMMLAFVTLLAGMGIKECIQTGVMAGMSLLMLSSSFFSFDPISGRLFATADTGKGMVYFSRQNFDFGGDPCVYNRQYYGHEIVYEKCLKIALDSEDELIAVSTGNNHNTWAVDGGFYAYDETIDKRYFTEFWNEAEGLRDPAYDFDFFSDPGYREINIRFIYPIDDTVTALKEGKSFTYIYIPTQNGGREDMVRDNYDVIEEGSFSSHGWIMSYIRGKIR